MANRSKSTLFLIEQLMVIVVFAICAVACINILTAAYFNAVDSRDLSNAVLKAESGAEVFKATVSDFAAAADLLGGTTHAQSMNTGGVSVLDVYYDSSWQKSDETNASYVLNLIIDSAETPQMLGESTLISGRVIVSKITGEIIISLPVAAWD